MPNAFFILITAQLQLPDARALLWYGLSLASSDAAFALLGLLLVDLLFCLASATEVPTFFTSASCLARSLPVLLPALFLALLCGLRGRERWDHGGEGLLQAAASVPVASLACLAGPVGALARN
jgi:hypothetical protein